MTLFILIVIVVGLIVYLCYPRKRKQPVSNLPQQQPPPPVKSSFSPQPSSLSPSVGSSSPTPQPPPSFPPKDPGQGM